MRYLPKSPDPDDPAPADLNVEIVPPRDMEMLAALAGTRDHTALATIGCVADARHYVKTAPEEQPARCLGCLWPVRRADDATVVILHERAQRPFLAVLCPDCGADADDGAIKVLEALHPVAPNARLIPNPVAGRASMKAARRDNITGNTYLEHGRPVRVLVRWGGNKCRNVLIERADGTRVVRPFRGLRKAPAETPENLPAGGGMTPALNTDQPNVVPLRRPEAAPPCPHAIRALERGRYALAHCAQLGFVPERYWDDFLELADIIREQQR